MHSFTAPTLKTMSDQTHIICTDVKKSQYIVEITPDDTGLIEQAVEKGDKVHPIVDIETYISTRLGIDGSSKRSFALVGFEGEEPDIKAIVSTVWHPWQVKARNQETLYEVMPVKINQTVQQESVSGIVGPCLVTAYTISSFEQGAGRKLLNTVNAALNQFDHQLVTLSPARVGEENNLQKWLMDNAVGTANTFFTDDELRMITQITGEDCPAYATKIFFGSGGESDDPSLQDDMDTLMKSLKIQQLLSDPFNDAVQNFHQQNGAVIARVNSGSAPRETADGRLGLGTSVNYFYPHPEIARNYAEDAVVPKNGIRALHMFKTVANAYALRQKKAGRPFDSFVPRTNIPNFSLVSMVIK